MIYMPLESLSSDKSIGHGLSYKCKYTYHHRLAEKKVWHAYWKLFLNKLEMTCFTLQATSGSLKWPKDKLFQFTCQHSQSLLDVARYWQIQCWTSLLLHWLATGKSNNSFNPSLKLIINESRTRAHAHVRVMRFKALIWLVGLGFIRVGLGVNLGCC